MLPSQAGNPLERSAESLLGDNPSEWAFGRVGQIHMGRAKPFWHSWRTLPPTSICCSGSRWRKVPIGSGGLSVLSIAPGAPGDAPPWHLEGLLYRGRRPVSATASLLSARLFFSRFIRHNVPVESKPCCAASLSRRSSSGGILKRHLMCLAGISPRNLQANFD